MASIRRALGKAAAVVATLPPVQRAMAKHVANEAQVRAHNERVAQKVSWFLRTPRWYQDALRPNFRGKVRKFGNRPVSTDGQSVRMLAADAKRARRAQARAA